MLQETWRLELFGPLCARRGALEIRRFRTQKTASLLAFLAYHRQRAHPRETLVELFWPEYEPHAGRESLSVALHALRKQLEPSGDASATVLIADRVAIRLDPAHCVTDVVEFERLLEAAAQAGEDEQRIPLLTQAIALYGSGLLPGFYENWVSAERERYADICLSALRRLIKCLAQSRQFDTALLYARQALQMDPLREESHRTLMRLYAAHGNTAAALEQFQTLERLLRDELNTTPGAATRQVLQQLRTHLHSHSPQSSPFTAISSNPAEPIPSPVPPISEAAAPQTNRRLPVALTRFFGREEDLDCLLQRLRPGNQAARMGKHMAEMGRGQSPSRSDPSAASRLVTILGPGGSGKTRLAQEVVNGLLEAYAGAVWYVPLADVNDPRHVPDVLKDALGLPRTEQGDALESVCSALAARPSLLVLDNLEHLLDAETQMPSRRDAAEVVRLLLAHVPGLRMLVTSRQTLDLTMEQVYPLMPLPTPSRPGTPARLMEFAGVQLFLDRSQARRADFQITPENAGAIAALCDRLEGIPLALELAAAWAQTLTPGQMLTRLSHRFDLLVSKRKDMPARHLSLRAAIEGSYRLLEPRLQRLFGHLSVFRGGWTLEAAEAICDEKGALEALQILQNRSFVLAEEQGDTMRFRLLETLREYAEEQCEKQEREVLQHRHLRYYLALAESVRAKNHTAEQAHAFQWLDAEVDNLRTALEYVIRSERWEEALRLTRALTPYWELRSLFQEGRDWLERVLQATSGIRTRQRALVLSGAGLIAKYLSDYPTAQAYHDGAMAIYREVGDERGVASELNNLGNLARIQSDHARAKRLFEESLAYWRGLDEPFALSAALNNLGNLALAQGDLDQAQDLYEQSLDLFRKIGDTSRIALLLGNLGLIAQGKGDLKAARSLQEESLALRRELGNRQHITMALNNLGSVLRDQGEFTMALPVLEECLAMKRDLGDLHGSATTLANLGVVAAELRHDQESIAYQRESLDIRVRLGDRGGCINSLESCADAAYALRAWERAAKLYMAADALRKTMHLPRPPYQRDTVRQNLEKIRSTLGARAFDVLESDCRTWTLEQAIAFALAVEELSAVK
ncbi:MAG TPA: tetratricopeptide repeat protein [Chthonomonadaceae bacterium]|nr:tetratricopeptide repeat protein [Chthonomonadaceae bacterium]